MCRLLNKQSFASLNSPSYGMFECCTARNDPNRPSPQTAANISKKGNFPRVINESTGETRETRRASRPLLVYLARFLTTQTAEFNDYQESFHVREHGREHEDKNNFPF